MQAFNASITVDGSELEPMEVTETHTDFRFQSSRSAWHDVCWINIICIQFQHRFKFVDKIYKRISVDLNAEDDLDSFVVRTSSQNAI